MIETVTKAYCKQKNHHAADDARKSIPNRIVSVIKPYVRPIVRGKEIKTVGFGARCNNFDGISFIEKLSFDAFSEGTRLKHCVNLAEKLIGVPVKNIGGDEGYSGNANRSFCSEREIKTSFSQKGRKSRNEIKSVLKQELARGRATATLVLLEHRKSITA